MRKVFAASVAAVALFTALGLGTAPAQAADCYGIVSFDDTYVCVVRVDPPSAQVVPGPTAVVPSVCVVVFCTAPLAVNLPEVGIDGGTVVLFHDGVCYYVEGTRVRQDTAPAPDDCP